MSAKDKILQSLGIIKKANSDLDAIISNISAKDKQQRDRISALENQLRNGINTQASVEEIKRTLSAEYERKISELNQKIVSLTNSNNSSATQIKACVDEKALLEAKIAELQGSISALTSKIAVLNQQVQNTGMSTSGGSVIPTQITSSTTQSGTSSGGASFSEQAVSSGYATNELFSNQKNIL